MPKKQKNVTVLPALGEIVFKGDSNEMDPHHERMLPRYYYWCPNTPSADAFGIMEDIAESIKGIAGVVRSTDERFTFFLSFDEGTNMNAAAHMWLRNVNAAFEDLSEPAQANLIGIDTPLSFTTAMAVNSGGDIHRFDED